MPLIRCMPMRDVKMLVVALGSPFLVGIYEDEQLTASFEREGKASDELPSLLCELFEKYDPSSVYFADGPGNLMAIKIAFVCLRTLCIVKELPLFSTDGFWFNGGKPIRAGKGFGFIKDDGVIRPVRLGENEEGSFFLPKTIDVSIFESSSLPRYIVPAA